MKLRMFTVKIAFCVILLIGCGGAPYKTHRIHDQLNDHTIYRMTGNKLKGTSISPKTSVELNLEWSWYKGKLGDPERKIVADSICPSCRFSLIVRITDEDWLSIEEGESLVLLIDKERFTFSGNGSSEHRSVMTGYIEEIAWYDIDEEMLNVIISARKMKVKVIGAQSFIEGELSGSNSSNFRRFWDEFFMWGVYYWKR